MRPLVAMDGRRLLRAVAFGSLVFVFVGGGMGFALAAGEDVAEELLVPEPRPGDKVVYGAQRVWLDQDLALGGTGDIQLEKVTYQWLPEQWIVDATFGDRLARPLQAQYGYRSGTMIDRVVYYDAVDGHVLMQRYDGTSYGTVGGPTVWYDDVPVVGDVLIGNRYDQTYIHDQYHYTRTPCGVGATPLQGVVYDGAAVVLPGRCGWRDQENQIIYQGEGWEGTGADRSYAFSALQDGRLRMAFRNGVPFPVELTTSSAEITDPAWAIGRMFRLELESYAPGDGAYTDIDAGMLPPAAGPIPLAPLTPWTLDDSGMERTLDLTLREAYQAALAAAAPAAPWPLGQPNLAAWLQDHPDGYLAAAWALEYHDQGGATQPQWIMFWVDDDAWLGKRVVWEAGSQGLLLPATLPRHAEVYDWVPGWLPDDVDARFPDRSQLPPALPRVADMVGPYHRMFGAEAQLNRYGFELSCPDEACDDPWFVVEVGRHVEDVGPAPSRINPPSTAHDGLELVDKLMVDANGEAEYQVRFVEERESVLPLDDEASPAGEEWVAATSSPRSTWVPPVTARAATGVSVVAVLAALLYYFWPAAKGLPFLGLFSRIRHDRLLDHPQRSRILDAVHAEPGVHFQELSRRLGLGHGVLEHHVRKLVDAELVVVRRSAGYTCYFPKATDRRMMDAAPMLRSGGSRAVLQAVAARPGASSRDLAVDLGLAPSTVSYHLKRLETAGLVLPDPRAGVRLTPLGEQAQAAA